MQKLVDAIEKMLEDDKAITHIFAVHCETTSGILNPIAEIAALVAKQGRRLLVDSMSAFGAIENDARKNHYDPLAASSNKCLEGVPGMHSGGLGLVDGVGEVGRAAVDGAGVLHGAWTPLR